MVFYCSLCKQTLRQNVSYFCSDCESIFHYRCLVMKVKRRHQCPICKSPGPLWKFWDGIPDSMLYEKPPIIREKPTMPYLNPPSDLENEAVPKDGTTQTAKEKPAPIFIPRKRWNRYLVLAVKASFLLIFAFIGISCLVNATNGDIVLFPVGIYFILVGGSFVSETIKVLTIVITMWAVVTAVTYSVSEAFIPTVFTTPVVVLSVIEFLIYLKKVRYWVFFVTDLLIVVLFLTVYASFMFKDVTIAIIEVVLTFAVAYATQRIFSSHQEKTGDFDILYKCRECGRLSSKEKMIDGFCRKCHSLHAAAAAHHGHPAFHHPPPQ